LKTKGLGPVLPEAPTSGGGDGDPSQQHVQPASKQEDLQQQRKQRNVHNPREELQRTLLRVQAEAGDHMVVELIKELGKGAYGVVFQGVW
jgi:methionine-rich copper-binding protein CopC